MKWRKKGEVGFISGAVPGVVSFQFVFTLKDFVQVYRNSIVLGTDLFLGRSKKWLARVNELEWYQRVVQFVVGAEKCLFPHCTIFF